MKLEKLPEGPEFRTWVAYNRAGLSIRHVWKDGQFFGEHFAIEFRERPTGHLVCIKEIWLTAEEFIDAAAKLADAPYEQAQAVLQEVVYGPKPVPAPKASRKR